MTMRENKKACRHWRRQAFIDARKEFRDRYGTLTEMMGSENGA
jgi:hypothetical protein